MERGCDHKVSLGFPWIIGWPLKCSEDIQVAKYSCQITVHKVIPIQPESTIIYYVVPEIQHTFKTDGAEAFQERPCISWKSHRPAQACREFPECPMCQMLVESVRYQNIIGLLSDPPSLVSSGDTQIDEQLAVTLQARDAEQITKSLGSIEAGIVSRYHAPRRKASGSGVETYCPTVREFSGKNDCFSEHAFTRAFNVWQFRIDRRVGECSFNPGKSQSTGSGNRREKSISGK
jgi:hypothetical protein